MTYIIEMTQGARHEASEVLKAAMLAADKRLRTSRIRRIQDENGKVVWGEALPTKITRAAAKAAPAAKDDKAD